MTSQIHPSSVFWSFKLPREHGAVIVFSLACIISLLLCRPDLFIMACCDCALWAMTLSLHRPRQLFVIAMLAMLALQFLYGAPLAAWIGLVWLGAQVVTMPAHTRADIWWREAIGVSGAALAPLVVSFILSGDLALHFIVCSALLASIFTGSALIRASRKETLGNPIPSALLSLSLWVCLAIASPIIAALSLIPYVTQSAWLSAEIKPSFKQLGQVQSVCLSWVGIIVALRIFGVI